MSSAPVSAGEAVLAAVQDAALGLFRPYDSEQATRFKAALEALSPNTRRRLRCAPICGNGRQMAPASRR